MKAFMISAAAFALVVGLSGTASANENNSENSARECGGTGLNPGQAFQLPNLNGGPAAGPDQVQTPPEFAELMGAESVGALIKNGCENIKKNDDPS